MGDTFSSIQPDRGVPPSQDGGYPLPMRLDEGTCPIELDGGTPSSRETEQHSRYLLRGKRYAACVHAGGLSCFLSCHPYYLVGSLILNLQVIFTMIHFV